MNDKRINGEKMMVYQDNIKIIRDFYESSFFKCYKDKINLKSVIGSLYKDPDENDLNILSKCNEISREYNDIPISADGLCGWKILYDLNNGNETWLRDYEKIRGSVFGELFWPAKVDSKKRQTINQQRYRCFGDRIDWTLYDIKCYMEDIETKMVFNKYAKKYLEIFKKDKDPFKLFVLTWNMEIFVDENTYEVYDLSCGNGHQARLGPESKVVWSTRFGIEKKRNWLENYLTNLLSICEKKKKL